MHIFRFLSLQGPRLGLDIEGERYDLSAVAPEFADISDWLYLRDRKMIGNQTVKPLFKQMPAGEVEQLKAMMADP